MKKILFNLLYKFLKFYIFYSRRLFKYDLSEHDIISSFVPHENMAVRSQEIDGNITAIHLKKPHKVYEITMCDGTKSVFSGTHELISTSGDRIQVKDLIIGDNIIANNIKKYKTVKDIRELKENEIVFDLTVSTPDNCYFTDDLLSHNSVTTGIFVVWYNLFHYDRNTLLLSKTSGKVKELMSKIDIIIKNLPYFLKPKIEEYNIFNKAFENGCKIVAETTTEDSGASFTVHLLYIDEFALISENIIRNFFRTVYPTISSSTISRMIITSTPRGTNKFYELYRDAVYSKNRMNPIRTDWYDVPGRDEEWKQKEIENLGNEEDFNQEYGNQFLSGGTLLLPSNILKALKNIQQRYIYHEFEELRYAEIKDINNLIWKKNYEINKDHKFIISIDLSSGVKRDYTVFNIMRIAPLSKKQIENIDVYSNETDFFKLIQVGIFRSNVSNISNSAKLLYHLVVDVFGNNDNVKVLLEMNHEGNYFMKLVENIYGENNLIDDNIWVTFNKFTKSSASKNKDNFNKGLINDEKHRDYGMKMLRDKLTKGYIILSEFITIEEVASIVRNEKGKYVTQTGNDDCAMTCVNMSHIFDSPTYVEMIMDIMSSDLVPKSFKLMVIEKLGMSMNVEEYDATEMDDDFDDNDDDGDLFDIL